MLTNPQIFRFIEKSDYDLGYLELLKQLTDIDPSKISREEFYNFIDTLSPERHHILVMLTSDRKKIVGSGTYLIEQKCIHNMGKVGYIEDIVLDHLARGQRLGTTLIRLLRKKCEAQGCYKIVLHCIPELVKFYEGCGFEKGGVHMKYNLL